MSLILKVGNYKSSVLIIISNLISAITWGTLATSIEEFGDRVGILMAGFFLSFLFIYILFLFCNRKSIPMLRGAQHSFFWSISFCCTYFLYFFFQDFLKLSHLMIAKSLAPYISYLFLRFDSGATGAGKMAGNVKATFSLAILLSIAFVESGKSLHYTFTTFGLLIIMAVLFTNSISQTRLVAKKNKLLDSIVLFCFFNFLFLFLGWIFIEGSPLESVQALYGSMNLVFLTFLAIIIVQTLLLRGTSRATDFIFVLFANSSVPISLVLDKFMFDKNVSAVSFLLSIFYLFIISYEYFLLMTNKRGRVWEKKP